MAIKGQDALTYSEWANRKDPNGNTADVVEILADVNPIIEDAIVIEANGTTSHQSTHRTGLPDVYYRAINEGIPKSRSTTATVEDTFSNIEAKSDVDVDLMMRNDNSNAFRLTEDAAFLEAMAQKQAYGMLYGDPGNDPKEYLGLTGRYNAYQDTDKTKSSYNVIHGGGSGADNCSIWFIQWDPLATFMFYPKGSKVGISAMPENAPRWVTDAAGNEFKALTTHYKLQEGLGVKDWRSNVRIANIDVSDIKGGTGADLIDLMIAAYYRRKMRMRGKNIIYVPEILEEFLHKQAKDATNVQLSIREYEGKPITTFLGIPIKTLDALKLDEDLVPAA